MRGGILIYHTISTHERWLPAGIATPPGQFAEHMVMLRRSRLRAVPLAEMVEHCLTHGRLPRGAVAVTFDDGYTDNFTAAAPVLRAMNIPATFFVATDFIGLRWQSPLGPIPAIRREQIVRMAAEPLFTFGSHAASHRTMTELAPDALQREMLRSAAALESLTGERIDLLAYPFGDFDERVMAAAAACGYRAAFAVHARRAGPMSIPRIPVHTRDNPRRLGFKLSRWYRPVRRILRAGAT